MINISVQEGGLKCLSTGFVIYEIKSEWLVILEVFKFYKFYMTERKNIRVSKGF